MDVYQAFVSYSDGDWRGTNNTKQLFDVPEERIRWVSTTTEMQAILEAENPCDEPGKVLVVCSSDSCVTVLKTPSVPILDHTFTPAVGERMLAAAKAAGKAGVTFYVPYFYEPNVPGLIWEGSKIAVYAPKKYKAELDKVDQAVITMTDVDQVSRAIVKDLLKMAQWPTPEQEADMVALAYSLDKGKWSCKLVEAAHRFVGRAMTIEKFLGKKKLHAHAGLKDLKRRWKFHPVANATKFRSYGASGNRLADWFERELKLPSTAKKADEPATALANAS